MRKTKAMGCAIIVVIAILFILVFMNPIVVIPPGHVGVKVLFGNVREGILTEGLHIINPLLNVVKMDARLQSYTMSIAAQEGERYGDDAIDALTSEGLIVRLDLTAWYRLIPAEAPNVYRSIGIDYVAKVVRPLLRTAIRDRAVEYTAEDIYSIKRDEFVNSIIEHSIILSEGKGVYIDRILLRNVKLPLEIENAINAKITADQDAQKMKFVLIKEDLEKDRKIIEAEGIREANRIIALSLTRNYLTWYRIEMLKSLIASPNKSIIVIPEDLKSLPMIMSGQ